MGGSFKKGLIVGRLFQQPSKTWNKLRSEWSVLWRTCTVQQLTAKCT